MSALAAMQRDFLAAVRGERDPGPLALYREQALAGWRLALAAAYPVVERLVGPAFFGEAAARYAERNPSMSGDLHEYGRAFADFLEGYPFASSLPYLPDVARLEWAVHESAFAADADGFDFASLAGIPPDRQPDVVITWAPATRLLRSAHPVVALWEANQPGADGVPARVGGQQALVARLDGRALPLALDEVEWRCACALSEGATLGAVADALGEDAARLPASLARFAAAGALGGFRLS